MSVNADEGAELAEVDRSVFIPGPPVPQPRMTRRSLYGKDQHGNPTAKSRAITRYLTYKEVVGWTAKTHGIGPLDGFVHLTINIYTPDRQKRKWDLSGVVKTLEDALNMVAYHDDKQVVGLDVSLYTSGVLDRKEGVRIWVTEVL